MNLLAVLKDRAYAYQRPGHGGADPRGARRTHHPGVEIRPVVRRVSAAAGSAWWQARKTIAVGKISGAVGTFAHLPPEVEAGVCQRLGLNPAPISTQIIQRDRHAEFFLTLALIGASVEKVALEIRHLQRTEVREAEEMFAAGQKGSSAMPHKRNPILSENLCGLARVLRGNALAALENVALWHERDISHSSVERVIAPDSTVLLDFMLARLTRLLKNLQVYPENMAANLNLTRGLVFSQSLLLALINKGLHPGRGLPAGAASGHASLAGRGRIRPRVKADAEIGQHLSPAEIDGDFRPEPLFSPRG